jgi:poly [ADP-ribose] polymerase 2/3/4
VHIDSDGVIYDVSLNQTNAGNNNNKFYRIQLLEKKSGGSFRTWTRWGRVGERGQNAMLGDGSFDDAFKHFQKKFKDKSGLQWKKRLDPPCSGKYVFVERSYEPDSDSEEKVSTTNSKGFKAEATEIPESTLPLPVQHLMEFIFNRQYFKEVMADLEYDADKLPLGKLSKRTLESGYQALKV